ncbi:hypothetical protein OUZ56_012230 [Daphnia magna]|uniref:Uncharacterized protein n=1 Tax=Daphnia magna TaxID=35525 RepID=A0ABQ9Z2L4_9CRUS|nr:hypothetical protein OUZ56_012230 [Daphnia magna]
MITEIIDEAVDREITTSLAQIKFESAAELISNIKQEKIGRASSVQTSLAASRIGILGNEFPKTNTEKKKSDTKFNDK